MNFYRMGHAALEVEDLERSRKFYQEVLGFEPEWVGDEDWANLKLGPDDLSLVRRRGAVHPPHLGLRVRSFADLEAAHARLEKLGASAQAINKHRDGTYSFYFSDPDGNQLEALFDPRID